MKAVPAILLIFLLAISCSRSGRIVAPSASGGGDTVCNGGDALAVLFTEKAYTVLSLLERKPGNRDILSSRDLQAFHRAITETRIVPVDHRVHDNSKTPVEVDAAVDDDPQHPGRKVIRIYRARWERILNDRDSVYNLVFHELLRVIGKDDTNYRISFRLDTSEASDGESSWYVDLDALGVRLTITKFDSPLVAAQTIVITRSVKGCQVHLSFPAIANISVSSISGPPSPTFPVLFSENVVSELNAVLVDEDERLCSIGRSARSQVMAAKFQAIGEVKVPIAGKFYRLRYAIDEAGGISIDGKEIHVKKTFPGLIVSDGEIHGGVHFEPGTDSPSSMEITRLDTGTRIAQSALTEKALPPLEQVKASAALFTSGPVSAINEVPASDITEAYYRIDYTPSDAPEYSRFYLNYSLSSDAAPDDFQPSHMVEMSTVGDSGLWQAKISDLSTFTRNFGPTLLFSPMRLDFVIRGELPSGVKVLENGNYSQKGWFRVELSPIQKNPIDLNEPDPGDKLFSLKVESIPFD